jgi:hypothetical protein
MKKLTVGASLSTYELMHIPTSHFERIVKERLARELAHDLVDVIEWSERPDHYTDSKIITASLTVMDEETLKKFNRAMTLLKEVKE